MRLLRLFTALFFITCSADAQNAPVGTWTSHLPYNDVISIATDGRMLYAASEISFFTYDPASGALDAYSKTQGMSDVDMAWVAHDRTTGYTILTYKNGNIDLFKDRNFYNIPDFKLRVINGTKDVNGVYTENGLAYISTSVGIIVVNLEKKEIKETYEFIQNEITIPVFAFAANNQYFFANTGSGIYRINRNSPSPQVFSLWQKISDKVLPDAVVEQNIFFAANQDSLFKAQGDSLVGLMSLGGGGDHIDAGNGYLLVSSYGTVEGYNATTWSKDVYNYKFTDTRQSVLLTDGSLWVADYTKGIAKGQDNISYVKPNGPSGLSSYDIYAYDRNVLVAHGAVSDNWVYRFNTDGFSEYKDGQWVNYNSRNYPYLNAFTDFITITKDRNDGTIYAGSFISGLLILKADGTHQQLKEGSPILESTLMNPGTWAVGGLVLDDNNTLWVNNFGTTNELAAKTLDNTWHKFNLPYNTVYPGGGAHIIIDDIGQKWYVSPRGSGVIVYNDNGTLEDKTDDASRQLLAGAGAGNLPDNDVYAIAKDKNNAIWIGTRAGIGIVNCTEVVTTNQCDAEQPIVQFDQFAGVLFGTEIVYAIAVDGANRKWVGTANGVWLLSPSGEEIVSRFTAENSPLPSNVIKKITIDPISGDVYIGTEKGLVCYRGTATDGGETNEEQLLTFPNPVPTGYSGTIAIKGFVENADVRITDISGQLVYRTTAFGGQAVWNGLDYKGRRPQSGVYLVFATNKDGTEKTTGKIVFMQ